MIATGTPPDLMSLSDLMKPLSEPSGSEYVMLSRSSHAQTVSGPVIAGRCVWVHLCELFPSVLGYDTTHVGVFLL